MENRISYFLLFLGALKCKGMCQIFILINLIFVHFVAIAQNDRPFHNLQIQSPNAASLEKFGKIPVSYHSGIPQISIPLYDVSSGSLNLPISISYHAGGLKVMETSSWVGAGWSLVAGGAITREVRGAPDEDQDFTGVTPQLYGHYSDNGFNSYVRNLSGTDPNPNNYASYYQVGTGEADGEPDIYSFNFNGHSGQFYFDDDNTPIFVSATDYKVEVFRNSSNGFYKWIIITPNGTRYHFGQAENENGAIESAIRSEKTYPFREFSGATFHAAVSSWLLTKIESSDRLDVIRLHYVPEKYGYHTFQLTPNNLAGRINRVKNSIEGWRLTKITFDNGSIDFLPGDLREDLCSFDLWSGSDAANTEARSLDEIQIKYKDGTCLKKYKFVYTYFHNTSDPNYFSGSYIVNSDRKRLKLNEIRETCCKTGNTKPPYIFNYYNEVDVPRRLSYAQDHWGYFNGKTSNGSLIASNGSRESFYPAMRAGTLSKIIYPTGGSTSFIYEANQVFRQYDEEIVGGIFTSLQTAGLPVIEKTVEFDNGVYQVDLSCSSYDGGTASLNLLGSFSHTLSDDETRSFRMNLSGPKTLQAYCSNSYTTGKMTFRKIDLLHHARNFDVGGLRIASIIRSTSSAPGNPDDIVTTYNYNHSGISSGVLYGRPIYRTLLRNDFEREYGIREVSGSLDPSYNSLGCFNYNNPQTTKLGSMSSIFPINHSQGYHIGYAYVIVARNDGALTQYQYNTGTSNELLKYKPIAQTLIEDYYCDLDVPNYPNAPIPNIPGRGDLVAERHFSDTKLLKEIFYENNYETVSEVVQGMIHTNILTRPYTTFYELTSSKLTSKIVTTKTYDEDTNNSVELVQKYAYNSSKHQQIKVERTTTNSGIYRKNYIYPLDYTNGCEIDNSSFISYNNEVNSCNSSFPYDNYSFASSNWYHVRKQYDDCISTAKSNYAANRLNDKADAETCLNAKYSTVSADVKAVISLISGNNHLPIEISNWKDGLFLGSIFNLYKDYGTDRTSGLVYPENVSVYQIASPLPSSNFTSSSIYGNNLVKDSDYSPLIEVDYTFDNGKLIEITDIVGITNSYLWSYNRAFPTAKAVNATENQIAFTSFENGNSEGGWTFTNSVNSLHFKTGKKSHRHNTYNLTKSGLPSGNYIVTFWAKRSSTSSPRVIVNGVTKSVNTDTWTYYEISFSGTSVTVDPNNVYLDEVRLHPTDAQMTTYTYDPLIGMTSQTDPAGQVTTYEYGDFGRLETVRGADGNVLQHYDYNYKD